MRPGSSGVTLIELIAVMAILGVLASVSLLGFASLRPPASAAGRDSLLRARVAAVRSGHAVTVRVGGIRARFLPDGRVLGTGLDPITGGSSRAR